MNHTLIKIISIGLGFLFLIAGTIGIVLPVLPTTPFFILASFFFMKGSKRINMWFRNTKMFKQFSKDFIETKSMTRKKKIKILIPASSVLILSLLLVSSQYVRILLIIILICKYYYFLFIIKDKKEEEGTLL